MVSDTRGRYSPEQLRRLLHGMRSDLAMLHQAMLEADDAAMRVRLDAARADLSSSVDLLQFALDAHEGRS